MVFSEERKEGKMQVEIAIEEIVDDDSSDPTRYIGG